MKNLMHLWGRPVHLDTVIDGKPIRLSHDGQDFRQHDPTKPVGADASSDAKKDKGDDDKS